MRTKSVLCLGAAVVAALLTATSVDSAQSRAPRFLVTISGTQHFEWTLEQTNPSSCSFKAQGEQSETFGTARPVRVIAPPARTRADRGKEFQAFNGRGWGRVVPLQGGETRTYRVLRAPAGDCVGPELRRDCRGANPLVRGAGVALMRDRRTVALHVPVDTPWIARRPSVCDIRLFDLRSFYLTAVFGVREYELVRGGTFENRRAKVLRVSFSVRGCVDPSKSSDVGIFFATSCRPPSPGQRGPVLTGNIRANWTVTFRRTR